MRTQWSRNRVIGRPDISGQPLRSGSTSSVGTSRVLCSFPAHFNKDRNKLFFLFSQEYTKFPAGRIADAEGSHRRIPARRLQRSCSERISSSTARGILRTRSSPGTCNATDQTACFPGNIIPANRLSPQGVALLTAYPRALPGVNLGGNNWVLSPVRRDNQRKDTGAVDYLPAEAHYIRFRVQNFSLYHQDSNRGGTDRAPAHSTVPTRRAP